MTVRAKFTVTKDSSCGYAAQTGPMVTHREITMMAVFDDGLAKENKSFATATPSGNLVFTVTNPAIAEEFKAGETYYLDFTKAE